MCGLLLFFQSLLINGRGQYNCSLYSKNAQNDCNIKGGEQYAPYILHVLPNTTYRIRIASTTSLASLNFAIGVTILSFPINNLCLFFYNLIKNLCFQIKIYPSSKSN